MRLPRRAGFDCSLRSDVVPRDCDGAGSGCIFCLSPCSVVIVRIARRIYLELGRALNRPADAYPRCADHAGEKMTSDFYRRFVVTKLPGDREILSAVYSAHD